MKLSKLACFAVLAVVVSCQVKEPLNPQTIKVVASGELLSPETDSRTSLGGDGAVLWSPGDSIRLFRGSNSEKLRYEGSEPAAKADFTGSIPSGTSSDEFWAVSPYDSDNSFDGSAVYLTVSPFQEAADSSFTPYAFPALAVADPVESGNLLLSFKNICGGVTFTLSRNDIVRVVFSSNSNESIAGSVKVSRDKDGCPVVDRVLEGRDSIFCSFADESPFEAGTPYYISALPASLGGGFTMTFYTNDKKGSRTSVNPVEIKRNVFGNLGVADQGVQFKDIEEPLPKGSVYVKVTSAVQDWTGTYLLVAGKKVFNGEVNNDKFGSYVTVAVSDEGTIARTDTTQACEGTFELISDGMYAFHFANGNYLGSSDSNSGIKTTTAKPTSTDTEFLWTPSVESGYVKPVLTKVKNRYVCFNVSGFRTYKSTSGTVACLYRCESGSDTLSIKTVTTAESVTDSSAVIKGSYRTASEAPSEVGFNYGTNKNDLDQNVTVEASGKEAEFSAGLSGLQNSTTYYYQAYMVVDRKTYVGDVANFTTEAKITPPDPSLKADYGWFELPAQKDNDRDGIDDDNPDYYYSHTFRADANSIRNFSCCYSKDKIHPVWVAAPMHSCYKGSSGRNDSYKADPNIKCAQNGKFDGYTRGHMLGSSDRTVSVATNKQVFYYSNIGAQLSDGFNTGGGAWNNLESFVEGQWCSDTLYQVIGCIFEPWTDRYGKTISKRTASGSDIPTAYYKVLLRTKAGSSGKSVDKCSASELKCCAFILAHTGNPSHKPSAQDMYSVSEVEALTGLTFFVNVPNAPKSSYTASDWGM